MPVRLQIPKIKVDANIGQTGLTAAGDMDIPKSLKDVGWYKYSSKPGQKGTAVIAGHLDGAKESGVFTNLKKLQKDDTLSIVDDKGKTVEFVVRHTQIYSRTEKPAEVFNVSSDGAHLNLITCAGTWDKNQQLFSQRLVVFADLII